MNQLFIWGIENATRNESQGTSEEEQEQQKQKLQQIPRKFLDAMLRSEASKMKALVDIFTSSTATFEEKIVALEELEFLLQIIDNANDLHHPTVDGLVPLLKGVKSELDTAPEFRMRCCWALATALQNNPKVQGQVMELGGVQIFLDALNKEISENTSLNNNQNGSSMHLQLLSKIIFCLSSLLTHNKEAQKQFWKAGGFQTLNILLNSVASHLTSINEAELNQPSKSQIEEPNITPDEEITRTEDGGVIMNIVDIEDKVKDKAQQLKKIREENPQEESPSVVWLRLARRTLFMLNNLMIESEELKLVVVKENNGALLRTLLTIVENQKDLELKETVIRLLDTLTCCSTTKMLEYIIDLINKTVPIKQVLTSQKNALSETILEDHTELKIMIDHIVAKF